MKRIPFLSLFFAAFIAKAQPLANRILKANILCAQLDTISPANWNRVDSLDIMLFEELQKIIRNDSFLQIDHKNIFHEYIFRTSSYDGKIKMFFFDSRSTGTMRWGYAVTSYSSGDGARYIDIDSTGLGADRFYRLPSAQGEFYLSTGGGRYCSTCMADYASVIKLNGNEKPEQIKAFPGQNTVLSVETRLYDMKQASYDDKTHTLIFKYLGDDLNGEKEGKLIFEKYRWSKTKRCFQRLQ